MHRKHTSGLNRPSIYKSASENSKITYDPRLAHSLSDKEEKTLKAWLKPKFESIMRLN